MNQTTPFVGREKEIALFKQCFEAILPENVGKPEYAHLPKVLSFYGAAGVGKTALKNKFLEIAQEMYPDVVLCFFSFNGVERMEFEDNTYQDISLTKLEIVENGVLLGTHKSELSYKDDCIYVTNISNAIEKIKRDNKIILYIFDDGNAKATAYAEDTSEYRQVLMLIFKKSPLFGYSTREDFRLKTFHLDREMTKLFYLFHTYNYYETELKPLNFKESKVLLNGFFDKFDDQYLRKIYDYTKGYPEQLQFLVDLVRNKQVPAESILNELIKNEGKLIDNLKDLLFKNETLEEEKIELEHKVLSTATHNLNQKFGSMLAQFSTIKALIERLEGGETLPIPLEPELKTFYQILLDATQTFNTTARVLDKQKILPVVTNMPAFFESEIIPLANGKNYTIVLASDENLYAKIDQEAFKDAMRNLINNAEKHGFLEDRNDYQIIFTLSETPPNQLKITYQNNGRPFPKGFTFQDFKLLTGKADKKSKTKGAGIGGFWINKVIDLHKGSWTMRDTKPDDIFPIQFDIFLPKYEHHTD